MHNNNMYVVCVAAFQKFRPFYLIHSKAKTKKQISPVHNAQKDFYDCVKHFSFTEIVFLQGVRGNLILKAVVM